jgi:hypothetical protein
MKAHLDDFRYCCDAPCTTALWQGEDPSEPNVSGELRVHGWKLIPVNSALRRGSMSRREKVRATSEAP